MSDVIRIAGLEKRYGNHVALKGLDLRVAKGEVYGFLGRNGAGKSTTIRVLMGITQPTAGSVHMFGEPYASNLVRLRQRIGYVAQEQAFYGWMNAAQMGRFVRGFFPTWDDGEWARLVRVLEVPLDRAIEGFSGGMRVKLALALALAHRPELLLLDEPTAGLDPVARREFLEIVRSEAAGRTTFFSTHLIDEIERVATRVGIVDGGRTFFEGTIEALRQRVRALPVPGGADVEGHVSALAGRGFRVLGMAHAAAPIVEHTQADAFDAYTQESGLAFEALPLEEVFIALVRRGS